MNNLLRFLIFCSTIFIALASTLRDQPLCCGNGSLVLDGNEKCSNGQMLLPKCQGARAFYGVSSILRFATDKKGTHFIARDGYKVYSPSYCIANKTTLVPEHTTLGVLYCTVDSYFVNLNETSDGRQKTSTSFMDWLLLIETILCLASGVLLAITSLVYFILPQTQDIEGKCTFHLILMQCFFYFLNAFLRIARHNELALVNDFCITHWYFSVFIQLCYFTWCAILLHYMWKRFRRNFRMDESKLMSRYRIIGYGIPALLILLCSLHAHLYSIFTKKDIERVCSAHQSLLLTLYGGLPIIIIELMCAFFFICLQRHLWIMQPTHSPEDSNSSVKKFKFRFLMIAKLFTITGLPWLLILFCGILTALTNSVIFVHLIRGIITFITSEGIILFFILVIDRKRVHRGLADKFGISVRGWQQDPDSEESVDH